MSQLGQLIVVATGVTSLTGDSGAALSGALKIKGGNNITTAAAGSDITVNVSGTTNHAIQLGNASGSLSSLGVGVTGVILTGVTGADPTWTTATYPATVAKGDVLVASANNVIGVINDVVNAGYVLTANAAAAPTFQALPAPVVGSFASDPETIAGAVTNKAVAPSNLKAKLGTQTLHGLPIGTTDSVAIAWTAEPSDGQLLIGKTGNQPVLATISSGNNITATAGAGTISIAVTGTTTHAVQVGDAAGQLKSLAVGTTGKYLRAATTADPAWSTLTLPDAVTKGDVLVASADNVVDIVAGATTAGWLLTANGALTAPSFQAPPAGVTYASNAETIAGTVTNKAVAPSNLKAKLGLQTIHALPIGASDTAALSWLAVGATGETLMGATGADCGWTGSPSFSGSITAGTTITATLGNITATEGNLILKNNAVSTADAEIEFRKTRASAIISGGDTLGTIYFLGYDGANFIQAGKITCDNSSGTPAVNSIAGTIRFYTHPDNAIALPSLPYERMTIASTGAVSIAQADSPAISLTVGKGLTCTLDDLTLTNGDAIIGNTDAAITSPVIYFKKKRAGNVASGDLLGTIKFSGYDGTQYTDGARITSTSSGTIANTRVASDLKFYTHPDSAAADPTLRMTIAATGATTIASPDSGTGLTVSGGGITCTSGAITATSGNVVVTNGNLTLPNSTSTTGQITFNAIPYLHNFGTAGTTSNLFLGYNAGNFTLTAASALRNIGIGTNALAVITTATDSVCVGYSAGGRNVTTGSYCVFIGSGAGNYDTGYAFQMPGSVAIGYNAVGGAGPNAAAKFTAIGYNACKNSYGAPNVTAMGYNVLGGTYCGATDSTVIGEAAFSGITGGIIDKCTSVGMNIGKVVAPAASYSYNDCFGYNVFAALTLAQNSARYNCIFGSQAAHSVVAPDFLYNSFFGYNTGGSINNNQYTTQYNTFIGAEAGSALTSGNAISYNTFIGAGAGKAYPAAANTGSCICIGYNASGSAVETNTLRIGNGTGTSAGNIKTAYINGIYTTAATPSGTAKVTLVDSNNVVYGLAGAAGTYLVGGTSPSFATIPNGVLTWSVITSDLNPMVVGNGYIANKVGLLTMTLPTTAAAGTVLRVTGMNTAVGWRIAQSANQIINFGSLSTTTGVGGYLESTAIRDSVELVCVVANLQWNVVSSIGTISIV